MRGTQREREREREREKANINKNNMKTEENGERSNK